MSTPLTIFLADDHPIIRDGVRLILEMESDLKIIGEADNGRDALEQIRQLCPDVVIMDITMPDLNGFEASRQIGDICSDTSIIILSMHGSPTHILRALQAGADGYLIKGAASNEVVKAVRTVSNNRRYLSQKILEQLSSDEIERLETLEMDDPLASLSPREHEVLQLVVEGKSSGEIAEILYLSIKTVETYRYRLMHKLNIHDIPTLVKFAVQQGLTPPE